MIFIKKIFLFYLLFILFFTIFSSSYSNSSFYFPLKNHDIISSYFGYRELFDSINYHTGVDFAYSPGTQVHATSSGTVIYSGFLNGYGNCIILLHENGYRSLYGHLSEDYIVSNGDYVTSGQLIGYIGPLFLSNGIRNGNTTGPHLHFEMYNEKGDLIDPLKLPLLDL